MNSVETTEAESDDGSDSATSIDRTKIQECAKTLSEDLENGTSKKLIAASPDSDGYDLWKVNLDAGLTNELPSLIADSIAKSETDNNSETNYSVNRSVEPYSPAHIGEDESMIQRVDKDRVPDEFNPFLDEGTELDTNVETYENKRYPDFHAIIINQPSSEYPIIGFQQFTRRQILGRKSWARLRKVVGNEKYEDDDQYTISLPQRIDALYISGELLCFNQRRFESLFDFLDMFEQETETVRESIVNKDEPGEVYIEDGNKFKEAIEDFPNALRKLYEISNSQRYSQIDSNNAKEVIEEFEVFSNDQREHPIDYSMADGKLSITMNDKFNIWPVLRLLNDDHLTSPIIDDAKYESLNKREI